MTREYSDIAFSPSVKAAQARYGSRRYEAIADQETDGGGALGEDEETFISERDAFYLATVSETGWPYVQFRGGPKGFVKVLDPTTLGFADFRGNLQYVSVGNLDANDRVALILVDYAHRQRLKLWGRARVIPVSDDPTLAARLAVPGYRARVERSIIVTVQAFDWNCPRHITPRFTLAEVEAAAAPLKAEIASLRARIDDERGGPAG